MRMMAAFVQQPHFVSPFDCLYTQVVEIITNNENDGRRNWTDCKGDEGEEEHQRQTSFVTGTSWIASSHRRVHLLQRNRKKCKKLQIPVRKLPLYQIEICVLIIGENLKKYLLLSFLPVKEVGRFGVMQWIKLPIIETRKSPLLSCHSGGLPKIDPLKVHSTPRFY